MSIRRIFLLLSSAVVGFFLVTSGIAQNLFDEKLDPEFDTIFPKTYAFPEPDSCELKWTGLTAPMDLAPEAFGHIKVEDFKHLLRDWQKAPLSSFHVDQNESEKLFFEKYDAMPTLDFTYKGQGRYPCWLTPPTSDQDACIGSHDIQRLREENAVLLSRFYSLIQSCDQINASYFPLVDGKRAIFSFLPASWLEMARTGHAESALTEWIRVYSVVQNSFHDQQQTISAVVLGISESHLIDALPLILQEDRSLFVKYEKDLISLLNRPTLEENRWTPSLSFVADYEFLTLPLLHAHEQNRGILGYLFYKPNQLRNKILEIYRLTQSYERMSAMTFHGTQRPWLRLIP